MPILAAPFKRHQSLSLDVVHKAKTIENVQNIIIASFNTRHRNYKLLIAVLFFSTRVRGSSARCLYSRGEILLGKRITLLFYIP
jgi:hypothetical protein